MIDNSLLSQFDILEFCPDSTLMSDAQGKIVWVNQQLCKAFGYSRDEIVGQPVEVLMPVRFREQHRFYQQQFHASPKLRGMGEGRLLYGLKKSGDEFFVEISLGSLFKGELFLVVATIRDVSDREKVEQELIQAKRMAESANISRAEFFTSLSHELKTPLTAIMGYSELLKSTDLNSVQEKYLCSIQRNAENLNQAVLDMLDLSRAEAGMLKFENENFDLNKIILEVLEQLEMMIYEKKLSVHFQPVTSIGYVFWGPVYRIKQVILNLLSNAIKFTDRGSVFVEWTKGEQGEIILRVKDTGCGIASSEFEKIFLPFEQVGKKAFMVGSGIGLALSRKLAVLMNGSLVVEHSELQVGSVFKFTFFPVKRT